MKARSHRQRFGLHRERRGIALVTAVVVTFVLAGMALMLMTLTARHQQEDRAAGGRLATFYAAEAGLNASWTELQNGGDGNLGSADAPESLGGLDYFVTATEIDPGVTRLLATATDGAQQSRVEMIVQDEGGQVEDFGIFGERGVQLNSNCLVDSYDSSLGTYASQKDGAFARSNGNVGSNDDVTVAANAKVYGYAQYGPDVDDTISVAANVTISDGYGAAQTGVTLPAVAAPSYASLGAITVNANQNKVIGPGNLQYTTVTTKSNSSLKVVGPCNLVISSAATISSNSTWTFDDSAGPIRVYALNDFELKSNSTVATTSKNPGDLTFYLLGEHTSQNDSSPKLDLSSNSQFYGTVYAPDLSVTIASNFELYGAVKGRWLTVASNAKVHFDEHLANGALDPSVSWSVLGWRPLTGSLAPSE